MPPTSRTRIIQQWFALSNESINLHCNPIIPNQIDCLIPAPGEITLIAGPSGGGKSTLLSAIRQKFPDGIDLQKIALPNRPLVNCFGKLPMLDVLNLLGQVGLGEVWSYLKTPRHLSEGQRWRLRLALAIHASKSHEMPTLLCDEFAALLDRVTAAVVARSLRKIVNHSRNKKAPLRAVLVTSHDDLLYALSPDIHARCDFEGRLSVARITATPPPTATEQSAQKRPPQCPTL